MTDETTTTPTEADATPAEAPAETSTTDDKAPAAKPDAPRQRDDKRDGNKPRGKKRGRRRRNEREKDEFDSKIVDLARVTRVMAGGKRMRFRACVVVGDRKGRIGMGIKKGADVQAAVAKATEAAKKHLITVPTVEPGTVPHTVVKKHKGAQVMVKPAKEGTGIIAGGAVRIVMDLAGIENVVAKMQGSTNKVNNVHALMEALAELRTAEQIKQVTK